MPIKPISVRDSYATSAHQYLKLLIVGQPGVGKTRFSSTFPHVLYADAEGRLLSVRDRPVHRVPIASISTLEELKVVLDQDRSVREELLGIPVETVVIDTVDEIARLVIKDRLRTERKEAMAIQDWGYLADKLRDICRGFRNLSDLNVIFTCHLKSQEDSESGRVQNKPAIQGAVGDEIASYVDEAFLMVARGATNPRTGEKVISRYLQTYPDLQHTWIKDHSGTMPLEFPVTFEDDYERIMKHIFGEPVERHDLAVDPAALAVPTEPVSAGTVESPPVEPAPVEPAPVEPLGNHVPEEGTGSAEPANAPEAVPEATAASAPEAEDAIRCTVCGALIEPLKFAEFSEVRYGEPLCRTHANERNRQR